MSLRRDLAQIWTLGGLSPKQLARRVFHEIGEDNIAGEAAQLAYYFLFSLFPFLIFLTALLPHVPVADLLPKILELIADLTPATALELIESYLHQLLTNPRGGLLSFGIVLTLWSASQALAAIGDNLNRAYGVKEGRAWWKARLIAVLLTIALAVLVIASTVLLVVGPQLSERLAELLGIGPAMKLAWLILRWPIVIFLMMFGAALVYYFAPDVEQQWRWVTPGSVFAVLAWIGISLLFGFYVENFGNYDLVYGSIGAVIVMLTWMYLSGFVLLVGGEINAEIEHAAVSGKNPGVKSLPASRRKKAARRA
jgi:membrane protein